MGTLVLIIPSENVACSLATLPKGLHHHRAASLIPERALPTRPYTGHNNATELYFLFVTQPGREI